MNRKTWTNRRALIFARGLYHVAACDGVASSEEAALRAFMIKVGLPDDLAVLSAEPFDFAEASRLLDSTWIRRALIKACIVMVQIDGKISPAERDAMRAMALGLGIREAHVLEGLEGLEGPAPNPTTLVEWFADLAVDFVSWDEEVKPGYFWPFPHPEHPLAQGGEIQVERGQALVVRERQIVLDVITEGTHPIAPDTLPGLAEVRGWAHGTVSAPLLFVRLSASPIMRWGTADPVQVTIPGFGPAPIRAFGRFAFRFTDPRRVVERMARGTLPADQDVESRVRRMVSGRFGQALGQLSWNNPAEAHGLLNDLDALRGELRPQIDAALEPSGIALVRFQIENLTAPLELGLNPTSRKTESLTRIGRQLLGRATGGALGASTAEIATLRPCGGCLSPVSIKAKFCPGCGVAQPDRCGQCGHGLPERAKFCSECGTSR